MKNARSKLFGVVFSAACVVALALTSLASAALTVDAKDFTEPVETQLGVAVPIVVAFLAGVFVVGFLIRWIMKRARSAT
jgi:uncharacterized protein HemY